MQPARRWISTHFSLWSGPRKNNFPKHTASLGLSSRLFRGVRRGTRPWAARRRLRPRRRTWKRTWRRTSGAAAFSGGVEKGTSICPHVPLFEPFWVPIDSPWRGRDEFWVEPPAMQGFVHLLYSSRPWERVVLHCEFTQTTVSATCGVSFYPIVSVASTLDVCFSFGQVSYMVNIKQVSFVLPGILAKHSPTLHFARCMLLPEGSTPATWTRSARSRQAPHLPTGNLTGSYLAVERLMNS